MADCGPRRGLCCDDNEEFVEKARRVSERESEGEREREREKEGDMTGVGVQRSYSIATFGCHVISIATTARRGRNRRIDRRGTNRQIDRWIGG